MLRSLSKGHSHYGSFNRHFPLARTSSRVESVAQVCVVVVIVSICMKMVFVVLFGVQLVGNMVVFER